MQQIRAFFSKYKLDTWLIVTFVYAVLIVFLILPVGSMLIKSFWINNTFTFDFIFLMFKNSLIRESIVNSFILAAATTVITTILTLPICFIMQRYNFKFKSWINGLLLVPMVMPPFVAAIGMKKFFAAYGSVNLLLMNLGVIAEPINWFGSGFWGVVILEVLHLYPIMFLNLSAAMANVDPTIEEAAESFGASKFKIFRTITLPLMLPGYFAGAIIVFVWAFTDLGTPLMFDYSNVVPVQIFNMVKSVNENSMGYVLVSFIVLLTCVLFYISKLVAGKKRYEMLGRGHIVSRVQKTGTLKTLWIYLFLGSVIFVALLPHISVALFSISKTWFMSVLPDGYTLEYYGEVFMDSMSYTGIKNSLLLSSASTIFDIILGVMIAYILTRKKIPGLNLLDSLVMLPLALPGVVVAFGYVSFFSGTFLDPRINPIPLLIIAYAIRRLPYIVRAAYAGFQQTSVTLEEASLGLGASKTRTIFKITLPLITANIIAGALLCFSYAMLEVSDSLILAMQEKYYPITKAIYSLYSNICEGPYLASALGVIGIFILTVSILTASKILGKKMGELFRSS